MPVVTLHWWRGAISAVGPVRQCRPLVRAQHAHPIVTPTRTVADAEPKPDLILDITLWLQIVLLAVILWQWEMPIRPFPPIFEVPPPQASAPQP